jgi:CPA2 family monovalent cation:H+ antiporter-2
MAEIHALQAAIVLLLAGILAITLMRPLGLSPIVGYLLAGLAIGPHGLALIEESEITHLLAELGVVFLLFDIGLHFSLSHISDARRDILIFGPVQVGLCTLVIAVCALLFGLPPSTALIIGAALALSSTAVVVQTLAERGQQSCPVGISATAILVFQDICAIFLLILVNSLGDMQSSPLAAIGWAAVKAGIAFAAAIVIGRYVIGPVLKTLGKTRNEELFTAIALLIVLVTAAAAGGWGLSLTLGAFLGGMIISETPYRYLIQTEVKPFRGLLLGFFFITVGMSLDAGILWQGWSRIFLILLLLIGVKTGVIVGAALALKTPLRVAVQLGFLLSQGSEFAFVIFATPALQGALGPGASALLISAVALSLALTPALAVVGYRVATRLASRRLLMEQTTPAGRPATLAPVIIFGLDEIGRRVADGLEAHSIPYIAIEMDHDRFIAANADGYPVAFGDAGDLRLMETFQIAERSMIVVTIIRYEVSRALTPIIRERYPRLRRFIAVADEEEKQRFDALGMQAVVNRSVPPGLDLAVAVLRAQQVPAEKIHAWMQRQQNQALEAIQGTEPAMQAA